MRGDLHTLKRVCSYASKVMFAGEMAFLALTAATITAGIWSFFSDDVRNTFSELIKCGSSDLSLAAGTAEMTAAFIIMFITIRMIHDMMVSVTNEHSPFNSENAGRMKTISSAFLIGAVILTILEYLNRGDNILTVCVLLLCILISVVMYCLTIVFRYGSVLQDESDHTL